MLVSDLNRPWNLWDCIRPRIHKLNVTLRLPFAFYKALEEDGTLAPTASYPSSTVSTTRTSWVYPWSAICQLQQLRSLHVWLDHDDLSSWSTVKERLVLHFVTVALEARIQGRSRGEILPQIDVRFNLPKLHPRIARAETHFVQESAPPPFTIERRFRQRYHCEEGAGGTSRVRYEADFPIMHELAGFIEYDEFPDYPGQPVTPAMTMQEIEDLERRLWESGRDVNRELEELGGYCVHWGIV